MLHNRFAVCFRIALSFGGLLALSAIAAAQSLVQVPMTSVAAGIPATTYNGTTAASAVCSTVLDTYGDGCPPTQAAVSIDYGAASDSLGNLYIADYGALLIRVIYRADYPGNPLAAAIVAANPGHTFTPAIGNIYSIGGGPSAGSKSPYYCTGTSGQEGIDSSGDGCPAQYARIAPRNVAVDSQSNVFISAIEGYEGVRVIYVQGSTVANLIINYNKAVNGVTIVPQPGHMYALSNPSGTDFTSVRDVAVDANDNLYVSDNGKAAAPPVAAVPGTIKELTAAGPFSSGTSPWTTIISNSTTGGVAGDGEPVSPTTTTANITTATYMFCDPNNNLYIADSGDARVRVVYNSGPTPPLYVQGSNSTVVTNPVPGDIYSVVGGGTSRSTGSLASAITMGSSGSIGMDQAGNLYFQDSSKIIWRENAQTGIAVQLSTIGASTADGYSAATTPAAGVQCNGSGSTGPVMTDAYADGCPATEVYPYGAAGRMVFDPAGNFYLAEQRIATAGGNAYILRKYSFPGQFGTVATGAHSTITLAYTPSSGAVTGTPLPSYAITGDATGEFADAGNDLCANSPTSSGGLTCTYNATFQPALAGQRLGSLTLSSSGTPLVTTLVGGVGSGAQMSIDPATQTTIGSTLSPLGVGADQGGNSYISDATSNSVYESIAGATPTIFATGFSQPAEVAVNGAGTVYVADAGNNRIAQVAKGANVSSAFLSTYNSFALSNPQGVAVDQIGDVFVADTGNNRILEVSAVGAISALGFTGLSSPLGLTVDTAGDVFVADSGNARIVELSAAGVQSSISVSPSLEKPVGVAIDPAGNLYIADAGNLNVVQIPSGSTTANALVGNINGLTGIAADAIGDLFVGIIGHGELELNRTQITVAYPTTNVGSTEQQSLTLGSTGNASLVTGTTLSSGTDATDFSVVSAAANGCAANQTLLAGANCGLTATFQPTKTGSLNDVVTFSSNAVDNVSATLTGNGVNGIATKTVLNYTTTTGGLPLAGQAFTITATVTPASGTSETGTVTFAVDGTVQNPVSVVNGTASISLTLVAGSDTVTAIYSGDSNYAGSEASITFPVVTIQPSTVSLAVVNAPAQNAVQFTLTATLTSAASQGAIGGVVDFYVDGSSTPIVETASGNAASVNLTLATGNHTVVADYNGDAYYMSSTNTITFLVIPAGRMAITLTSNPTAITYGQSVAINAALTASKATGNPIPTGNVTFSINGGAPVATLSYPASVTANLSATLPIIPAGNDTITVTYSGDNNYAPYTATLVLAVARAAPALTLNVVPIVGVNNNSFTLTSTASSTSTIPTGTVTFSDGITTPARLGTSALSVAGVATYNTVTNAQSSYVFTASYSGDANFLPATVSVTPSPTFTLTIPVSTISVPQNSVGLLNVNLNSFYGYTGQVTFSCTGLPANALCRGLNSSNPVAADVISGEQVQIFTNVNQSVASLERAAPMQQRPDAVRFGGMAAAAFLLFGLPLWKRRGSLRLFVPVLALIAMLGFSGCGSDTASSTLYVTPTGTYSIGIVATDGTITETITATLTVLPGTTAARP
jgi:hypothetical protein